ncbi:unnamed protein product [Pleuronectes platessa]|uniref:Heme NO-binding domain-containing protein n=1 Tax=Pleuronectes platessa TaxID=8262 RepID=A0A9N7UIW0_PLEPL|nr:unnamed protein product [Pleuronectes platessa]
MYGFVNHALELLVLRNYGPEVWEDIKREAQLDIEGQFLVRIIYEDGKTYDLVAAASKVLKIDAGDILQMFGKMFFEFCQSPDTTPSCECWDQMFVNSCRIWTLCMTTWAPSIPA